MYPVEVLVVHPTIYIMFDKQFLAVQDFCSSTVILLLYFGFLIPLGLSCQNENMGLQHG